ncbi:MAG: hypothetical protein A4S12_07235 [Proteobacteria bacterium SG_bin5]|nr:MAG: hypothetical protein A4S12_07235 [Proteobacteria bacterium SG_bin5]
MTARRELLFATPVIIDRLAEAPAINAALEPLILARRAADPGITRSNQGGWHSDLELLHWARDPVTPVIRRIVELADAATEDLQARPGHRRGWSLEAWANVNPTGAANAPHHHGGCYWSAVYYVRVDPGAGGELVLHDPRLPALDAHAPMLRFRDAGGEQLVDTRPEPGMLILFPAWLTHSVRAHDGAGLRISIAVNLSANRSVQPL